ncbi:MAG: diguanylate cyclase [Lachnospiraceae bacterium]|nr:diguanylate cyclase [Lachnospiraceae bacterium]MBO4762500.1 diguanylate cyclase [Lachnospiraceae bacterium]MBQ6090127.1 diguanylate cyclase [Lachnospiraceae bacterium]MBR5368193.1 diguanylate cyclase [Lachnospiraceae bacterium]
MEKILLVDDNNVSLSLAKNMLGDKYEIYAVISGEQALKFLEKKDVDLILLDINMPDMSGFETLKLIREMPEHINIPIIFLTSDADPETERKCFEMGAFDYIVKPFQKITLCSRVARTLDLVSLRKDLEGRLLEKTKQIARISLKSMMMIANTVDKKDPLAAEHSNNVAWFSVEIAKKLGWNTDDLYNLQNLALIHDIGNIGVPETIIRKKGQLTPEEYDTVKKHTTLGRNILADMTVIRKAAEVAETHHERYDGKGYPNGLSGRSIPIEARIIAIADAFDSMTTDRAFRKKLTREEVLNEFTKGRGTQFDPELVDIALELLSNDDFKRDEADVIREEELAVESSRLLQDVLSTYTDRPRRNHVRDPLTGLWSSSYAMDEIDNYLSEKRASGCFMLVDIDGFSQINDNLGHIVGDSVIKNISVILSEMMRNDDIICRVGGDEFILFFKDGGSKEFATAKAEEIILYLDDGLKNPVSDERISVSIGITLAQTDGKDFATLYNKADKALYLVKENGKHSYHFFSDEGSMMRHTLASTRIDLEYLKKFVSEKDSTPGGFMVEYESFKKIFRFLGRAQRRTSSPVILLLLTITAQDGSPANSEILEAAMIHLKSAITTAIRSGDVTTNYSSSQYLAILLESTTQNGYLIAERIRKIFYESIDYPDIRLTYDIDTTPFIQNNTYEDDDV